MSLPMRVPLPATPADPAWTVWAAMPDPASLAWPLARMPEKADIAGVLSGQLLRIAADAVRCDRVSEFLAVRDASAPAVLWKLVALDQLEPTPLVAAGEAVAGLAARAGTWGGDAWSDAVEDSWSALGHARSTRARLAREIGFSTEALSAAMVEHGFAVLNWTFSMLCTVALTQGLAAAGSEEVLDAVRSLLLDSGRGAYRSLRTFELSRTPAGEPEQLFRGELGPEDRALEEEAWRDGELAARLAEQA